jgi:cell division protein FtsA
LSAEDIIVALDLGTGKVTTLVGAVAEDGNIEIIGVGQAQSTGMKKGVVINIEETVRSVEMSVEEAERMADIDIDSVYIGLSGAHISSQNSRGVIAVAGSDREITHEDVERVIEAARAAQVNPNREVIHIISREFIVDDQRGIKDPVGMSGIRLEADVHIVTGAATAVQNVLKSVQKAGLQVRDVILSSLASAEAVLTTDEKELGVLLLDIGAGTTDICLFVHGAVAFSSVIPLGGDHITNDVAVGLKTPTSSAETIKKLHGCAMVSLVEDKELIEVPVTGSDKVRTLPKRALCEIIEPRVEEIFRFVRDDVQKFGAGEMIPAGCVVTGGTGLLNGIDSIASEVLDMQVRIGVPGKVSGLSEKVKSSEFATGLGLLNYGMRDDLAGGGGSSFMPAGLSRLWDQFMGWIRSIF